MTTNPEHSFAAHSRASIIRAQNNLAEVTLFVFGEGHDAIDTANAWHLLGNLVIASSAGAVDETPTATHLANVIESLGGNRERAAFFFNEVLTRESKRSIFALGHIPNGAPELRTTKTSRELRVAEFIKQAHLLNPGGSDATEYHGMGNHIFTGMFHRKLS